MNAELSEDYLVERSAIDLIKELKYSYVHGSDLSPEKEERESYRQVILKKRFIESIKKLNPWINNIIAEQVYKKITEIEHPDFIIKSKLFYEMLVGGVKINLREKGKEKTKLVKIIDFENPEENEFLVANQLTIEYQYQSNLYRKPDIVVFVNGIPLAIFELKSFNANETAKDAYYDHKIKMPDIPQLYVFAQILVASDGLETKYGSTTSDWDRFFLWEGINDDADLIAKGSEETPLYYVHKETGKEMTSLEVLIKGLFNKDRFIDYLEDFIFYEKSGETFDKKIAMFHQFYVVRKAVKLTINSVLCLNKDSEGNLDKRIGVVWHTQGTGKSLTMLFYARKVLKIKELEYPILLFLTDRNNLDEQLSGIFSDLPIAKRAQNIKDLQKTIGTMSGGIIFATIQKFGKRKIEEYPHLTDRHNIIVIADEAHRSQYRELAMNLRKAIPNASFMGFTATPIELEDRSTTLVFGSHISVYSMEKARRHGVVVPIYYEARLSKLHLTNEFIDEEFEDISEFVEPEAKEALKKKYAKIERLIMAEKRIKEIAEDIVTHFNKRVNEFKGKAIVVTISRKAAIKLYKEIKKLPNAPSVVVVMSGNKQRDPEDFKTHIRNKHELEDLAKNFKNPESGPEIAIVVDMWLTGFDVPCLHTMYMDKPMKGHSLVQAIARVNRVFQDKPGGLIVDYIGIADDLRKSLSIYTLEAIKEVFLDINEVIKHLKEKYDIVTSLFHGINYKGWEKLSPNELAKLTTLTYERISRNDEIKKRFIRNYVALKKLYALASPHPEAFKIKNDIRFFEMIKKMVVKYSTARIREINRDLEYEISHLISKSIAAEEPIDVFSLMGVEKPDISIFDEKFLSQFRNMKYKNYAAELLSKIIKDQLIVKMKVNPFRYRSLYEMLTKIIDKYNIKLIDTAEIIEELIKIAHEIKKATKEGKDLNLSEEELAFYDLLCSRHKVFEDYEEIEKIAREIVKELGYYIKVADWNRKEYLKAKIRTAVKNVLIRFIDARISYRELEQISMDVVNHAEMIYAAA